MPEKKYKPEQEGRFDMPLQKRPEEDELHEETESPYSQTIISPSMVKINDIRPSFDLQALEYANEIVPAYMAFVAGTGPAQVKSTLKTKSEGVMTFEYTFKDPKSGKITEDMWDYQGPMQVSFEASFTGDPLGKSAVTAEKAIEKFFRSGGYVDTDPEMQKHEKLLANLRPEVSYKLLNFAVKPFWIPYAQKKAYRLKDRDFVQKILSTKPQLFVHWRSP